MKKVELLSPAGNMETLISAIDNGADAVYVGGENFSARAFAKNFSKIEMKEAVRYAHIYDVKLYVAVNTVIFEDEVERCLDYLKFLYEINVDAVIMQDIGMMNLVRKYIPNLEVHASTQVNCHSDECLKFLKRIGVKRVVLSRELDIDTINNLKTDIELEVFIHGALCVSYSGRCLFSSLNGGRSGNRGMCVGSCRLPYDIYKGGKKLNHKYPLSTKELCTIQNIDKILKLGISSLKIEGRMKSPEYVGYVTRVYRRIIDEFYSGKSPTIKEEELINIAKLFNRKFTSGYLFGDDVYNTKSSNHLGYHLGKVIKITDKKIYIKLDDDLNMEDGIRFISENMGMIVNKIYNREGLLVSSVKKGDVALVDNKINLRRITFVNKTVDKKLVEEIKVNKKKRMPISFILEGHVGKPLTLMISDGNFSIKKTSVVLDKALNKPTTKEEIERKLRKVGNTPFEIGNIDIDIDDVFIPLGKLNDLRHSLIKELIQRKTLMREKICIDYKKKCDRPTTKKVNFFVTCEKQLLRVKDLSDTLFTDDYNLYLKYKYLNIYYKLPSIMESFPEYNGERLLIGDLGSLNRYYKNNDIVTDYPLNVTNSESVKLLRKYNVKLITISPEITNDLILNYSGDVQKVVYGRLELMIIKNFYLKGSSILKNKFGNEYKIINNGYTKILHYKPLDRLDEAVRCDTEIILEDNFDKIIDRLNLT